MITAISSVEIVALDFNKERFSLGEDSFTVQIQAWSDNQSIAHCAYSTNPTSLLYSRNMNRLRDGFDFFLVLVRWGINNEIVGLSVDTKPAPTFERHLPIVALNGSLFGSATLLYMHQSNGEYLSNDLRPRSRTELEEKVTTSVEVDPLTYSTVKQLSAEKSRLQNRLGILELQLYEREAVIGSLNIQLKIRQEESKYLYTAERLKEITTGFQTENKELRDRLEKNERELKFLRENADRKSVSSSINGVSKQLLEGLSVRMSRLSNSLNVMLNGLDNPVVVSTRYQQTDSEQDRVLTRQILSVQRMANALLKKHTEQQEVHSCLQQHIQQLQENLLKTEHELNEQRDLYEFTKNRTSELIGEIKRYTEIVERKERETQDCQNRKDELESQYKSVYGKLCDARLQNERLRIEIDNNSSRITQLESSNFELAESNRRIRDICGLQGRTYRAGLESQSRRFSNEQQAILEQHSQFRQREERLRKQRDAYKRQLDSMSEQLERLYVNCERSDGITTNSLLNESKESHISKLVAAQQSLQLNQKKRSQVAEEQLKNLTRKYEKDMQRMRQRIRQLEEVQKSTVELSNTLGFSISKTQSPLHQIGRSKHVHFY